MGRWLVQLAGERMDLEEYPYWFPDGEIHAIEEDGNVYLAGEALERLPNASRVHEVALEALDDFSAVISLLWPSLQRPRVSSVMREDDQGDRERHVHLSGSIKGRAKAHGSLTVKGTEEDGPSPTQAQTLLAGSQLDKHLQAALFIWSDPLRPWARLYRILEEIEQFLGENAHEAGLCSHNQRNRFTQSANTAEVAGKDARHALDSFRPPANPMRLKKARQFIGCLLRQVLARAATEGPPNTGQ